MNFASMEFIVFFPVFLLAFWNVHRSMRPWLLLAVSYFFYISGGSFFDGIILMASTLISWLAAKRISAADSRQEKRAWLWAVVLYSLICLAVFKQEQFLVAGISFYTFQSLSYVADVYAGTRCEENLGYYALFVSFFPQLVAGPIERADHLLPQLRNMQEIPAHKMAKGFYLILRGFFKKIAVADYLAGFVDAVYGAPQDAGGLAAVAGTVCFAFQIYCDFSGYTDIARGTARMIGVELMENFKHPYAARNMQEFWRRWHVSLTKWFADYVYIPLGGNRKGIFRHCVNICIVFTVSGLWHGLSWNFVVWGLLHGILVAGHICRVRIWNWVLCKRKCQGRRSLWRTAILQTRIRQAKKQRLGIQQAKKQQMGILQTKMLQAAMFIIRPLQCFGTFSLVCFAWIFFRAETLPDAFVLVRQILFGMSGQGFVQAVQLLGIQTVDLLRLVFLAVCLVLLEKMPDTAGRIQTAEQAWMRALTCFYMAAAIALSWLALFAENGGSAFIYFAF